ncbi:hypothetical protein FDB41_06770 [Clostridium botulinum]|nr:hypothetical protein [Clostridium botulinum]NFO53273.1 hypothetical protein [Clostridium botulinum]
MNKQVKFYNIKLGSVKTVKERELSSGRDYAFKKLKEYKDEIKTIIKDSLGEENWTKECGDKLKIALKNDVTFKTYESIYKKYKNMLHEEYSRNKDIIRYINSKNIKEINIVAVGNNNLVRTLGIGLGEFTDVFIEIEVGKTDDLVAKNVTENGLYIDNKFYIFFTSGAGQMRKQRFMLIREGIWNKYEKTLMCGLTIEELNKRGGLNISKFLAYLSLNNSSSEIWKDFKIDKCIVVNDFETMVSGIVDYIDRKDEEKTKECKRINKKKGKVTTYNRKYIKTTWDLQKGINKEVPIPHFDGAGIMLTSVSKKNIQFRMPWFKGLLTPVAFREYIKEEHKANRIEESDVEVLDVWGQPHKIIKEDIRIIFSASQFKLWKMYDSWNEYKEAFKKYNCTANICETDEDEYKDMQLNYQMFQTLTDMDDLQIKKLAKNFEELHTKLHGDRESKLEFLGATLNNKNRDYMQECLRLYPEMITSDYIKEQLVKAIKSAKNDAKSGRIVIPNTKRMFLLPDPVAFMEWLFKGEETPKGCLEDGEVYCKLYEENQNQKLDVLRSPHLSFEHAIRINKASKEKNDRYKYLTTNGIYTSTHDLISKILNFDVDGDHATVISEPWIVELAENMINKYNINPLYYEMGKAGAKEINNKNIFESLKFVFHKSNIGKVSNTLTKIWNDEEPWKVFNIIRKLCAHNNDVIDGAKTLSIRKLPDDVKEVFKEFNNKKYPYFFHFAKGYKSNECEKIGNSVMDRLCKNIDGLRANYNWDACGRFDYKKLMCNQRDFEIDYEIIDFYLKLEEITRKRIADYTTANGDDDEKNRTAYKYDYYNEARKVVMDFVKSRVNVEGLKLRESNKIINKEYYIIIDNIIKYTMFEDENKMAFIFNVFGATIINNLNKNLKNCSVDNKYILCEKCGERVKNTNGKRKLCEDCANKVKKSNKKKKSNIA